MFGRAVLTWRGHCAPRYIINHLMNSAKPGLCLSTMAKVKVQQGWLEGDRREVVTKDGHYYSFKGIPYSAPPVGKLRFKAPRPPLPWEGVRKAIEHGAVSPQLDIITKQLIPGNEDCLFLNVYSPDIEPKTPLPVMFFVHGGGYRSGFGDDSHYGPDFLVNHGVVLVTINYRLEAFGFLCMDTKDVPGNAGLKDQVAALKWVQENISKFGGDPSNVTVFGQSAGGASAALHVLSPLSKGLFKRSIPMSGVPLCDWSVAFQPARRAFTLGKILGFQTDDPDKLLEFLQSVPAEKLVLTNPCVLGFEEKANNFMKMYHFTPVVEKDFGQDYFMVEEPLKMLKKGKTNNVDVLIGHTSQESLLGVPTFESSLLAHYNRYPEILVPRELLYQCTPSQVLELSQKIHEHYFGKKPIGVDVMKEFVGYVSETSFIYNIHRFLENLPTNKNKTYFYRFSCVSERNIYGASGATYGLSGASHLDDLMYLFQANHANLPIDKNSKGYKMIQLACKVFTNFAKYGNPTPDASLGVTWPTYDSASKSCGDISDTVTIGNSLNAEEVAFWKTIFDRAGVEF